MIILTILTGVSSAHASDLSLATEKLNSVFGTKSAESKNYKGKGCVLNHSFYHDGGSSLTINMTDDSAANRDYLSAGFDQTNTISFTQGTGDNFKISARTIGQNQMSEDGNRDIITTYQIISYNALNKTFTLIQTSSEPTASGKPVGKPTKSAKSCAITTLYEAGRMQF